MTQTQPVPQGDYVPATRHGELIHTAGMTPRLAGQLLFTGPVRADASVEDYREAVVLACRNALTAAQAMLGPGETITRVLSMTVYIATGPGFTAHSRLADFASAFLREELAERGRCARAAIGVATLPGNAPVEIQLGVAAGS
jgi:enamine deaminase RidA (YjgF/YER057c/UK114 family)|nr:RidA family protein [uncultured Defluviimonas sp.]